MPNSTATIEKSEQLLLMTRCRAEAAHAAGQNPDQGTLLGLLRKARHKQGDNQDKREPRLQNGVERGGESNKGRNLVTNKCCPE